jgi:hypothetical protein
MLFAAISRVLDASMTTRAGQAPKDLSIGVQQRSPLSAQVEAVEQAAGSPPGSQSNEHASSSRAYGVSLSPSVAAGFLFVMVAIGSTAGLAWRLHSDLSLLTAAQHRDSDELGAAVQRLEVMSQQAGQRLDALQQAQVKQQSQLGEIHRLSQQLSSLQGELEKVAKSAAKQEPPKRHSEGSTQPKTQASNGVATSR